MKAQIAVYSSGSTASDARAPRPATTTERRDIDFSVQMVTLSSPRINTAGDGLSTTVLIELPVVFEAFVICAASHGRLSIAGRLPRIGGRGVPRAALLYPLTPLSATVRSRVNLVAIP